MRLNAKTLLVAALLCAGAATLPGARLAADEKERVDREARFIEILQSGASVQEKDQACRELQVIGTRTAIPALAFLLTNRELSHMARYALEPMPYAEAGKALRAALPQTSGLVKVGIINSLGYRREEAAVPDLAALFKDPDSDVVTAAVAALGRIGSAQAAQALDQFRATASPALQSITAEASLSVAEGLMQAGRLQDAVRIYAQLENSKWPVYVRQGALDGLLTALPNEAATRITRVIGGKDPALKPVAIARIPALKDPGAAERFAAMLPRIPAELQVLLMGALADCESKAGLPALQNALASSNQEVKVAAVKALGKAGDDTCVKPLVRVLAGPEAAALKKEAVSSLERMKGEKINAEIQACLSSAAGEVRIKLVEILAARRATDAFDAVFQEASQGDPGVRTAAFKALGSLGTGANLPALLRLLTELKGEEGRAEAELAAVRLARKIPEESQQTVAVMTLMKNTSSPTVQASLLRVLGGIANWDALEAMRIALGSKDAEVKETAIQVLAQWPDSRAIDLLLGEWQTARSPAQKSAILRGVVRLLRRGDALPSQTLARYQFLLDGIQRPEDKILVLSGLAEVNHPAALPLVEPLLADPQTRAEAELSMVQIARRVQGSAPLAAQGAAGRLWREAQSEEVRQQAAQLVREIEQCEEFVMTWQVAGPYSRMGGEGLRLLSVPLPPEAEPASVEWRDLPVGSRVERPWMLDLTGILGEGRPRAAYARTWIYMERGQNARMELAVDDPVKVWLNGELVHLHNVALPSVTVASQAGISLKPGWNLLMLKIVQMGGPWEFGVKLLKPDGEPLEGVRFDAAYGERLKTEQIFSRADSGWTQLFNGKDLSGWRQNGDAIFTVENGILLGTQTTGKGGDLFTESEWDNFELRVTYRIVWPANSGFWFRAAGDKGYQFDVLKWKQPVGYSGTLYMPGKLFLTVNLNEGLENRDGWNEACIRARGDELKVWLNGVKVGECRESTHSKGKIGIQVHPGDGFKGMKVMVRTLEIRRIGDK